MSTSMFIKIRMCKGKRPDMLTYLTSFFTGKSKVDKDKCEEKKDRREQKTNRENGAAEEEEMEE